MAVPDRGEGRERDQPHQIDQQYPTLKKSVALALTPPI